MNKSTLGFALIAAFGVNVPALAAEPRMANEAVVGDASGQVVTDSSGECVGTSSWTKELANEACAEKVEQAAMEPEPVIAYAEPVVEDVTLAGAALFAFDSAEFQREQAQLDALAERVKALESIESVNIVGHADSVGSEAYNQKLSERRADAVKEFLISRGIDAGVIHASGQGESRPVADNGTKEGRAQNRRVEIRFEGTQTR